MEGDPSIDRILQCGASSNRLIASSGPGHALGFAEAPLPPAAVLPAAPPEPLAPAPPPMPVVPPLVAALSKHSVRDFSTGPQAATLSASAPAADNATMRSSLMRSETRKPCASFIRRSPAGHGESGPRS